MLKINNYFSRIISQFGLLFFIPLFRSIWISGTNFLATIFWKQVLVNKGKNLKVGFGAFIVHPQNFKIGDNVSIQTNVILGTELFDGKVLIGNNVQINKNCKIDYSGGITIGSSTLISEGVVIYTHCHGKNPKSHPSPKPLEIGANVWIGAHARIMQNVEYIGDNSIIAANAVVIKNISPNSIVGGNPARFIKKN